MHYFMPTHVEFWVVILSSRFKLAVNHVVAYLLGNGRRKDRRRDFRLSFLLLPPCGQFRSRADTHPG
jgi:hypothetical protein